MGEWDEQTGAVAMQAILIRVSIFKTRQAPGSFPPLPLETPCCAIWLGTFYHFESIYFSLIAKMGDTSSAPS